MADQTGSPTWSVTIAQATAQILAQAVVALERDQP